MFHCRLPHSSALAICCLAIWLGCSRPAADLTEPAVTNFASPTDTAVNAAAASENKAVADFYTVAHYDESRDPAVDLADAIKRAESEGKRIILQVGGDWCEWCGLISSYMQANQAVRKLLDQHFLVMKVAYPSDQTESFLAQFPQCSAYPTLLVLERDGTFLHSQATGVLEQGRGYDQDAFARFLSAWIR